MSKKLRVGVLGLTLASSCVLTLPAYAQVSSAQATQPKASKQENIGVLTGLAVGAAAGGPIGAIVGAAAGGWMGDHYHKQLVAKKDSEERGKLLARDVDELNVSLADERAKSEKLGLSLEKTADLQTDIAFRTNDDRVNDDAVAPLRTIAALAASMPDVKVRVLGFADPRGSADYNTALSQRRAAAVAAVLEQGGLAKERMIVEGHGKSESTALEGDVDGYAFERKVSVRLEHAGAGEVAKND